MKTKELLINSLIDKYQYKSFLEIGTQKGYCYDQIVCDFKKGIDPNPIKIVENQFIGTSDQFFECNNLTFDLIFIDGLHHADQVLLDLVNAANILNYRGTILLHDMLPTSELMQRVPRDSIEWYGDCWKLYPILKDKYNLRLTLHEFDCGILEIQLGNESVDDLLCDYLENLEKIKKLKYAPRGKRVYTGS